MERFQQGLALAVGGGGARGFAHVGVLQVLEARGVRIEGIVGVSAGSVAGAGYALGYSTAQMRQRVLEFAASPLADDARLKALRGGPSDCLGLTDRLSRLFCQGLLVKSFLLDKSVMGHGYFEEMIAFFLPEVNLEDTVIPFAVVAVDIQSGEKVVLDKGDLRQAVHASCAVPGVAATVEIDGRHLVDGGAACLVPTIMARRRAQGLVLAVNVDKDIAIDHLPSQALEYYLRAGEIQGYHLVQLLCDLADLSLQPALGDVHWADFKKAGWIMDQGVKAAQEAWHDLEQLFKPQPWWRRLIRGEAA